MWHELRNGIIMQNVIYVERQFARVAAFLTRRVARFFAVYGMQIILSFVLYGLSEKISASFSNAMEFYIIP